MAAANKKEMGQYFTTSEALQQFVFDRVRHKGCHLLEPSFGAGHLLRKFIAYDAAYPMTCYELDSTIEPVVALDPRFQKVIYGDFTQQQQHMAFQTIIANPPYVKRAARGGGQNLYLTFVQRCFELLAATGEMIFIIPSDFLKLTSASPTIEAMTKEGAFTDFWFPHDEKLFEGASIDVVVFRYEKGPGPGPGPRSDMCVVNGQMRYCHVRKGIVTFSAEAEADGDRVPVSDLFHVYVGLVSGRDGLYNVDFGNIQMLQDKDVVTPWIFTTEFPTADAQINAHLLTHKPALLDRRIKKFGEHNWFEWGAPRNIKHMETHWGKPCLYVRNMTRQAEVAFAGTVQYFGGALLCLVPKQAMGAAALEQVCAWLNTAEFRGNYTYAQRFKMGQKQLENAMISRESLK